MNLTIPSPALYAVKGAYVAVHLSLFVGLGTGAEHLSQYIGGTGGQITQANIHTLGYGAFDNRSVHDASYKAAPVAADIDYIRSALKVTTAELARYLGVSRQAIYDWKSGASIKSHNIKKLENLRAAADVIADSGIAISSFQLKRKLTGGHTMLEAIESGDDGTAMAHTLVSLLQKEAKTRLALSKRFAGRKPINDSDYGANLLGLREDG